MLPMICLQKTMADHSPALQLLSEEVVCKLRLAVTSKVLNERNREEICWHELLGIFHGIWHPCHDPFCYTEAEDCHIYAAAADVIRNSHVSARAPVLFILALYRSSPHHPNNCHRYHERHYSSTVIIMAPASLLSPLPAYAPLKAFGAIARQTTSKRNRTIFKAIRCTKCSSGESHAGAWDKVSAFPTWPKTCRYTLLSYYQPTGMPNAGCTRII